MILGSRLRLEEWVRNIIIAYVPVLHAGYLQFFDKFKDTENVRIYVLCYDALKEFEWLQRDIRAVDPLIIVSSLLYWYKDKIEIFLGNTTSLLGIQSAFCSRNTNIIMPDEDISHEIAKKYLSKFNVVFDSIFLRWDKHRTLLEVPVVNNGTINIRDLDKTLLKKCIAISEKSSDWWRQVGALIAKPSGEVLLTACNEHVPHPQMPYINGDPRSNFTYGINIELGTALHAEKALICQSARRGISIEGTYLYTTTFPCPPCAKAIAYCGVKRVYYRTGYAMLDGESILKSSGIEIVQVLD